MIESDIEKIPLLKNSGLALFEYIRSLFPLNEFIKSSSGKYVASPDNFISITIHHKQAKNITLTLRGNPFEYCKFEELAIVPGLHGYSSVKIENPVQLAAAAFYVRRAAEIYRLGTKREMLIQTIQYLPPDA
jgi:hypothetical protein